MIRERDNHGLPGLPVLLLLLAGLGLVTWVLVEAIRAQAPLTIVAAALGNAFLAFLLGGLFMVNPNEGRVLQLFGDYVGTAKEPGLRWANPFYGKKNVSLRVRNFESSQAEGQRPGRQSHRDRARSWCGRSWTRPRRSSRWTTTRTTCSVQSEAALRNLATSYPYDAHDEAHVSLRGKTAAVAEHLKKESPGAAGEGGRGGDRGAHQPPGLRAGNRRGDAAAAAGRRDHRRAAAHRRGRRRHGGNGARAAVARSRSSSSTRSARPRWSATCWSCCAAIATAQPVVNTGTHLPIGIVADRKAFLLRVDPAVLEALQRWANDDLRSLNAQIEFLLRRVVQQAGRDPDSTARPPATADGRDPPNPT